MDHLVLDIVRFLFRELPGQAGGAARPVVPVRVGGWPTARTALLDTGSRGNRFARSLGTVADLDLRGGEEQRLALGGFFTTAITVPTELHVGDETWRAPVSFCDPWPLDFQILGLEGFFRFFRVEIRAAEAALRLEREP